MNIRTILIGASLFSSMHLAAQFHQLSLGVDAGLPIGTMSDHGAGFILGPTLGYEAPLGLSRWSLTLQTGYQLVFMNENPNTETPQYRGWNMIPAQLGFKHYFTEPQLGWYAQGQAGIHALMREFGEVTHTVTVTTEDEDGNVSSETSTHTLPTVGITSTLFSYALGVGYQTPRVDISLRYQGMGSDGQGAASVQIPGQPNEQFTYPTSPAYSYIGLRIAYLFNLGGVRASAPPPPPPAR